MPTATARSTAGLASADDGETAFPAQTAYEVEKDVQPMNGLLALGERPACVIAVATVIALLSRISVSTQLDWRTICGNFVTILQLRAADRAAPYDEHKAKHEKNTAPIQELSRGQAAPGATYEASGDIVLAAAFGPCLAVSMAVPALVRERCFVSFCPRRIPGVGAFAT